MKYQFQRSRHVLFRFHEYFSSGVHDHLHVSLEFLSCFAHDRLSLDTNL